MRRASNVCDAMWMWKALTLFTVFQYSKQLKLNPTVHRMAGLNALRDVPSAKGDRYRLFSSKAAWHATRNGANKDHYFLDHEKGRRPR